jgi:hypothetical protein
MMASNALAFPPRVQPEWTSRAQDMLTSHRASRGQLTAVEPEEPIDLGLRAGVRVRYQPDRNPELPDGLKKVVEDIRRMEALHPNWDSYKAFPLDDRAVSPTIELTVEGIQRCAPPAVVPLPSGGIGLRWRSESAELEIDVGPDGLGTALLEIGEVGEEVVDPVAVDQLFPLLHRFCSSR